VKKRILYFLLMLFVWASLFGQNTIGLPQIVNFGINDFHAGAQTWDIKQDKWGRMYFANNEGLLTYDGNYWKLYAQPNKTILRSIAIDDKNRIYAGGQDEIGFYAADNNGILQYKSLKNLIPLAYKKFTDVWDIEIFKGAVFFRTADKIFEYKNDLIQTYPATTVWQFMKMAGGKLFALDKQNGLFQFSNNIWQPLFKENPPKYIEITGITSLADGSFLISSLQNGLFMLSNGTLTKKTTLIDDVLTKGQIYALDQINETEFVIGTTSNGCIVMNNGGEVVQKMGMQEGIKNNNVLSVFLDKEKNIWAGLDNGISYIAYNAAIKYIKPSSNNEVSGYAARVFNNALYIATSDGAYVSPLSLSNNDFSFSKGNFTQINNSGGQVWRLDEVNQQLLMGHHNGAFIIQNNTAIQLSDDPGIWLFQPTSAIQPASNILAGSYAGLTMYEFANNKFTSNYALKGLFESLRFLTIDNNNNIWASHPYRGVYKISLSLDNKSFTAELFTDKNGLPSTLRNYVFNIKSRIIFATERGLYEYDAIVKKIIPSPLLYDLFGAISIQYLNEDTEGNIWFCTDKKIGVAKYVYAEKKYRLNYFPELGGKILAGFENVYAYNKQNVFIASNNGIIHMNYEKYNTTKSTLNVLLTQVNAFGKKDSLIFGGFFQQNSDTTNKQNNNSVQQFPNSNNSFHFEFSAPSFATQNNIEYSYQLVGYEKKWNAWTSKTEKDYTNLPSGSYTFNVKAKDNTGIESEIVSYVFEIKAAWYNTIWAYLLYALLFIVCIFYYSKWQQNKFTKQQIKFEEKQKQLKYIHQLEIEKNEKAIIELQNEKLVNEVIYKNKELADASMHLVERGDALVKVKDELQQLYKKTGGNHDVKKAIQLVSDIEKNNTNWEQFSAHFDEVNNGFLNKLKSKFPSLTNTDLKVCAYLQLKLSSKEIAQLMNITVRGVELNRYRLRKKLNILTETNLFDFLNGINKE
jgi:ligand-binding sensor domain-containing protein/DNA-binding CsgD family transcriptional regulator/flagellar biogenesis protein FliO